MGIALPNVGDWYKRVGGDIFEVVAIDIADGCIEIQHFDGTVEEIDSDVWYEMKCSPAVAPEDYSGSLDLSSEDYTSLIEAKRGKNWGDPLDFLDQND